MSYIHILKEMKNSLLIGGGIAVAGIAIAVALLLVQANKQASIERQQQQQQLQNVADSNYERKKDECEALAAGVKRRWSNVLGVTYDGNIFHECIVTYADTKTGAVSTSWLSVMQDVN